MIAARMGRSRKRPLRKDWESAKDSIMHEAVLAKFTQHSDLREILLGTGEATIVEEPNVGGKWVEIARSMSRRYLGPHGPDYIEPTMQEPRWLIFVKAVETTTWQGVDWAKRYKHTNW